MNSFFNNITKKLDLETYENSNLTAINLSTWNTGTHVSITKIREFFPNIKIWYLNAKKSSTKDSIPANILKQSVAIYLPSIWVT